jgi:hypothetical protein
MTIYRLARNMAIGENLPRKFWPGGRNSGVNLGRKFWPPEIPNWNFRPEISAPLQRVAPQLVIRDLAKNRGGRKFCPNQRVAPQPFVRDLAEFSRVGNYRISGPRKFCQTRISGPFTECCTTTFCKGLGRISKGWKFMEFPAPGNFVQGRKFWPWGGISGPEAKFPALEILSSG